MRIVSLLPAGTEMVCALGLGEALVGVSHECAFPPQVAGKPVVMRGLVPTEQMSQAEIDAEVTRRLHVGEPIYEVDGEALERLSPDLLITQELCEVCAASPKDLAAVLASLAKRPEVLQLTPRSLGDILQNLADLGQATGRRAEAERLIASLEARIKAVRAGALQAERQPRVFCMEWLDPPYCSGHWVPEMVSICNAVDALSKMGTDSVRVPWQAVLDWAPEMLLVMPCGYDLEGVIQRAEALPRLPGWQELPAVAQGRVFAVDANSYFACPGPRVVDGLELLAHLIRPEQFTWSGPSNAFSPLRTKACSRCAAPFLCRPEPGCWCEAAALPAGAAERLCQAYGDCLCPDCLPVAEAEQTPAI